VVVMVVVGGLKMVTLVMDITPVTTADISKIKIYKK